MKIISFGCSYTAGAELLDHLVDHNADTIKREKGMLYWQERHRYQLPVQRQHWLTKNEAELAWSGQLARRLGAELDCRAVQGCSLGETVNRIEKAWYQGALRRDVLVLVGVTHFQRSMIWTGSDETRSWVLSSPKTWPEALRKLDTASLIEFHSDQYMMGLHLTYLLRLSQISEKLGGNLIMFDMMGQLKNLDSICDSSHTFRHQWREIAARGCTRFDLCLDDLRPQELDQRYPGGHPFLDVHVKFADWAMTRLPVKDLI